jgi:hypothetical protein
MPPKLNPELITDRDAKKKFIDYATAKFPEQVISGALPLSENHVRAVLWWHSQLSEGERALFEAFVRPLQLHPCDELEVNRSGGAALLQPTVPLADNATARTDVGATVAGFLPPTYDRLPVSCEMTAPEQRAVLRAAGGVGARLYLDLMAGSLLRTDVEAEVRTLSRGTECYGSLGVVVAQNGNSREFVLPIPIVGDKFIQLLGMRPLQGADMAALALALCTAGNPEPKLYDLRTWRDACSDAVRCWFLKSRLEEEFDFKFPVSDTAKEVARAKGHDYEKELCVRMVANYLTYLASPTCMDEPDPHMVYSGEEALARLLEKCALRRCIRDEADFINAFRLAGKSFNTLPSELRRWRASGSRRPRPPVSVWGRRRANAHPNKIPSPTIQCGSSRSRLDDIRRRRDVPTGTRAVRRPRHLAPKAPQGGGLPQPAPGVGRGRRDAGHARPGKSSGGGPAAGVASANDLLTLQLARSPYRSQGGQVPAPEPARTGGIDVRALGLGRASAACGLREAQNSLQRPMGRDRRTHRSTRWQENRVRPNLGDSVRVVRSHHDLDRLRSPSLRRPRGDLVVPGEPSRRHSEPSPATSGMISRPQPRPSPHRPHAKISLDTSGLQGKPGIQEVAADLREVDDVRDGERSGWHGRCAAHAVLRKEAVGSVNPHLKVWEYSRTTFKYIALTALPPVDPAEAAHPPSPAVPDEPSLPDAPILGVLSGPVSDGEALIGAGGRALMKKLKGSLRDNNLDLAPVTSNRVNQEKLMRDSPHLREVLAPLNSKEAFMALFNAPPPVRRRRPLSRGMLRHYNPLVKFDMVGPLDEEIGPGMYDDLWCPCFLVPKKNGQGRFISDCRPINQLQSRPPPMGLPRIHDVIRQVLSFDLAAKTDGVGYFYQFALHPSIRNFFKLRLGGQRGEVREARLNRMPMGWARSPYTAQQVSNFLAQGVGVAWVDDFIIGGSREQFAKNRRTFQRRLHKYNVEVDSDLTPTSSLTALGLEFDLNAKRYRLAPDWAASKAQKASDIASAQSQTFRQLLELWGTLIWASYARGLPLWTHPECLAALSQVAKHSGALDDPVPLPDYCRADLDSWIAEVRLNEWRQAPSHTTSFDDVVFSDASSTGAAFLRVHAEQIVSGQMWQRADTDNIFLAELAALIAADGNPLTTLYCTDNSALYYALRKGHSSSYAANKLLGKRFASDRPAQAWIPTDIMPADKHSRAVPLPDIPGPIDDDIKRALQWVADRYSLSFPSACITPHPPLDTCHDTAGGSVLEAKSQARAL